MVALGTPLLVTVLLGGPLMGPSYTVRSGCAVETDAACPSGPGNPTDFIVRNFTDVGLAGFEIPASHLLLPTDPSAELSIHHGWIPWKKITWRFLDSDVRSVNQATCAGEVAKLHLSSAITDLDWLKVQLWQIPSLQPQRCAIAPTVCLTDC
jgi:hypothetical protein